MPIQKKINFKFPARTMSMKMTLIRRILAAFGLILQFFTFGNAQYFKATIKAEPKLSSIVVVNGKNPVGRRNLSFLFRAAGTDKLGERISDVNLFDQAGNAVTYKKFIAGEYVANADFWSWNYKIDLSPSPSRSASAHISWITARNGVFMLDDMLPKFADKENKATAEIEVELPEGWRAVSGNRRTAGNDFASANVATTVIYVGEELVHTGVGSAAPKLSLALDGKWNFTRSEAIESAKEIFSQYRTLFDSYLQDETNIAFMKFPIAVGTGEWEAETRGANITIVSSDMPFDTQSRQRMHEQLRHEMFHLWIPNGVNLSGNYDWFYEGFALYQSLKIGVASNRIRFDDFLDTLGRALAADRMHSNGVNLIDASKNRFGGANSTVYARGMAAAFLCDLVILERSKGKRSIENILREIYQKHHGSNVRMDGNDAVLAVFGSYPELKPIVDRYIKGGEKAAADVHFRAAGIEVRNQNAVTILAVAANLNSRQKDLLDKLGYNTWRKLANISK